MTARCGALSTAGLLAAYLLVEGGEALELALLLGLGGAGEFERWGTASCCGLRKVLTPMGAGCRCV